jgi:hypothetical protein
MCGVSWHGILEMNTACQYPHTAQTEDDLVEICIGREEGRSIDCRKYYSRFTANIARFIIPGNQQKCAVSTFSNKSQIWVPYCQRNLPYFACIA